MAMDPEDPLHLARDAGPSRRETGRSPKTIGPIRVATRRGISMSPVGVADAGSVVVRPACACQKLRPRCSYRTYERRRLERRKACPAPPFASIPPHRLEAVGRKACDVPVDAHSRPLLDDRRAGGPGACWAGRCLRSVGRRLTVRSCSDPAPPRSRGAGGNDVPVDARSRPLLDDRRLGG